MMFKRRVARTPIERVSALVWPTTSWSRSARYTLHRIVRLRTSPHAIALGAAAGVFVACTPLLGAQMLLAALLAVVVRASVPAALLATFVGNPLSWPVIWGATYAAGAVMLGDVAALEAAELGDRLDLVLRAGSAQSPEALAAVGGVLWPFLKAMLAGSVPVGLVLAVAIYYMIRPMARAFAARRAT
jgi:uncharacterized protein (DUF2062 family)